MFPIDIFGVLIPLLTLPPPYIFEAPRVVRLLESQ